MYLTRKYELETVSLRLRLETGVAMYLARKYELGTVSLRLRLRRRDSYFTWSSTEPRELSLAVCRTKAVPSFLGVSGVLSEFGMNTCSVGLFVRVDVLQNFVFLCCENKPCCLLVCHYSLFSQARIERKSKMVSSGE